MKKITKKVINKISKIDFNIEQNYNMERILMDLVHFNFVNIKYKRIDSYVLNDSHKIPVRFYYPKKQLENKIIIFFHGGGWVSGSINSYDKFCAKLSLKTNSIVASIDYRLSPEFPFPAGLTDCYLVTKKIYEIAPKNNIKRKNITIMGDSAGANLAAAISLMARDKKEFKIRKQILFYPALNNDYTKNSKYKSVNENGENWILTSKKIQDYMKLYIKNKKDLNNPYVAPLLSKDLSNQPKTLIFTAELDPLRDEGEDYGRKLLNAKNKVKVYRLNDTIHGFINNPLFKKETKLSLEKINEFIKE